MPMMSLQAVMASSPSPFAQRCSTADCASAFPANNTAAQAAAIDIRRIGRFIITTAALSKPERKGKFFAPELRQLFLAYPLVLPRVDKAGHPVADAYDSAMLGRAARQHAEQRDIA